MMPTISPCQACGWEFYGFAYAGEGCSEECDAILRSRDANPTPHDAEDDAERPNTAPEIFPGTLAALNALTIRKATP